MKQKIFKGVLVLLALLILIPILLLSYVKFALPDVGAAPDLQIKTSPEKIERGKYLAHHVAACMSCHSQRDWNQYAGPTTPTTYGGGGEIFDIGIGKYYARDISPKALGDWSDGEIFRAITTGVSKNGDALFPLMPYQKYGKMDEEDIHAIIAYIKTLPHPQESVTTASNSNFPMNFIINTIPQKAEFNAVPDKKDFLQYGKYMTTMASCKSCHTPQDDKGQYIETLQFAGGMEFPLKTGGIVRSTNITPDKKTGLGTWTKEVFIERFKAYADSPYISTKIGAGDFNTAMPWTDYAEMTEEDLGAIYTYLQSLTPIENTIEKFVATSD